MYTIISHLFYKNSNPVKLLSTENGYIKLRTLNEVEIYAHTQGIFYYYYKNRRQYTEYYIKLAELMRSENRNKWAARCYFEALDMAWRIYIDVVLYGSCFGGDGEELIDPYEIYKTMRLYMLEMGNMGGLKKMKKIHQKYREYVDMESQCAQRSKYRKLENKIDQLFDADFDTDSYDY